ncbi:hypothetical protein [Sphingomonas astaxanthinifaciens]|uniref:Uncharacterized protein n=1 Tax=Sphingomonas astaxanthinifaciens DSM 22298 TaxID=1123267 RepID=A0ABQ5ZCX3_9SPHN|nr:hypothetical protein [Sphingomonas astaxanthinifaciens]GLR48472.1 hypothetical protein GCM10007925_21880 [Sphingomonas astaxanthinifaciens DSM 22298]
MNRNFLAAALLVALPAWTSAAVIGFAGRGSASREAAVSAPVTVFGTFGAPATILADGLRP